MVIVEEVVLSFKFGGGEWVGFGLGGDSDCGCGGGSDCGGGSEFKMLGWWMGKLWMFKEVDKLRKVDQFN